MKPSDIEKNSFRKLMLGMPVPGQKGEIEPCEKAATDSIRGLVMQTVEQMFVASSDSQKAVDNRLKIILIHQPLFFGPIYLIGQLCVLTSASRVLRKMGIDSEILYIFNDYDSVSEKGFRNAHLPHPTAQNGSVLLTAGQSGSSNLMIRYSPVLTNDIRSGICRRLSSWADSFMRFRAMLLKNTGWDIRGAFSELIDTVTRIIQSSSTLAEINENCLRTLSASLGAEVEFKRGVEFMHENRQAFANIVEAHGDLFQLLQEAVNYAKNTIGPFESINENIASGWTPLWIVCPRCHVRVTLISKAYNSWDGSCPICQRRFHIDPRRDIRDEELTIFPKAILQSMTLSNELGSVLQLNHLGAAEYTFLANHISQRIYGQRARFPKLFKSIPVYTSLVPLICSQVGERSIPESVMSKTKQLLLTGRMSYLDLWLSIMPARTSEYELVSIGHLNRYNNLRQPISLERECHHGGLISPWATTTD
ncbi:MAG: hypothetical protein PHR28_00040 [candidate division Zixibacteria bacterium]|nr:hypothetical protein [candidate division Zixibacteria bacterium]